MTKHRPYEQTKKKYQVGSPFFHYKSMGVDKNGQMIANKVGVYY